MHIQINDIIDVNKLTTVRWIEQRKWCWNWFMQIKIVSLNYRASSAFSFDQNIGADLHFKSNAKN